MVSRAKPGPQSAVCVEHSVLPRQGKTSNHQTAGVSLLLARSANLVAQRGRGFKGEGALRQPTPVR